MHTLTATTKTRPRGLWLLTIVLSAMIFLIIAAVSIPNLLHSRIAANESSAVGSLRTLNTAAVTYRKQHPGAGYPSQLSDLAPYIDANLASGHKSGYSFRYEPARDVDGTVKGFRVEAVPLATGQSGIRRFSADDTGVIRSRSSPSQGERPLDGEGVPPGEQPGAEPRRTMRRASLRMTVAEPEAVAEKVRAVANRSGGYVDSVRIWEEGESARQASVAIRVPAAQFDDVRRKVRELGERVNREEDDARDVTGQYVDLESNLRNYHAEEAQYLAIMRRSGSIKDTLAVAERLADVRGRIERTQGQLNLLAHQTEMAVLEVNLCTEVIAQPVDVRWHPRAEIKSAFWSAADDLSTYANFMITVAFRLPVFILWATTLLVSGASGWRLLRWAWKRLLPAPLPAA